MCSEEAVSAVPKIIEQLQIDALVADFLPVSKAINSIDQVKEALSRDIPVIQICKGLVSCIRYLNNFLYLIVTGGRTQYHPHLGGYRGAKHWYI